MLVDVEEHLCAPEDPQATTHGHHLQGGKDRVSNITFY